MKKIILFLTGSIILAALTVPFFKVSALTFLDNLEIPHNSTVNGQAHKYPSTLLHANVLTASALNEDNRALINTYIEKKGLLSYTRVMDTNYDYEYIYDFTNEMIGVQYPHRFGVYEKGTYRYKYSTKTSSGYYGSFVGTAEAFGI